MEEALDGGLPGFRRCAAPAWTQDLPPPEDAYPDHPRVETALEAGGIPLGIPQE